MTGYFKWIGAFLGFYLARYSFLGAVVGFLIGGFIDNFQRAAKYLNEKGTHERFNNQSDLFEFYRRQAYQQQYDFPTILIILSAAVMKADNKVLKSELNFVKSFFSRQFGSQFNQQHLQQLKAYINQDRLPLVEVCSILKMQTPVNVRAQLVQYLFGIAQADGNISSEEKNIINDIAFKMGVNPSDFEGTQNKFYRNIANDYKTLGLTKEASDSEIKKAYRKLALKYHPDKVSQLDEIEQEEAKEKFQKIQDAYEAIKKERKIN